jgi:ribosomal protein S27E
MTIQCPYCGAANVISKDENQPLTCVACGRVMETSAEPPGARKILIALVILFLGLAAALLFYAGKSKSSGVHAARHALFGSAISGRVGADATGSGESGSGQNQSDGRGGSGSGTVSPDAQATGEPRGKDESIGRLPDQIGPRSSGDEVRPGAAGVDRPDANRRIGNSREVTPTNAPSAGGNPGNSDARNSLETPNGSDRRIGVGSGDEPSGPFPGDASQSATNQDRALLLDDFSERLRQAGARSGDVQISLEWKNINDLDLHVIDPNGEEIFYNHRQSRAGGKLDVDMNANSFTTRPVENVYWPENGAARGNYRVDVVHFANHGAPDPTQFTVRVVVKGRPTYYRGYISYVAATDRARIAVCSFKVD